MVELAPWKIIGVVFLSLIVGAITGMHERIKVSSRGRRVTPAEAPELHAAVERLCVVADLPKPDIKLERQKLPNSWIEGTKRGGYRLHLTEGLIDLLEPKELEAVIAHELAHVANRDAAVMTVIGGPGEALLQGGGHMGGWFPGGLIAAAIGGVAAVGTRALSRYREFAADAGAVRLTGSPATLAAALMKVSDGLTGIPRRDLRAAAGFDAFHLLPTGVPDSKLMATHPTLEARIARLERLEKRLQHG